MATIAHTLPVGLADLTIVPVRPIETISLHSGGARLRDHQRRTLREYSIAPPMLNAADFILWRKFLNSVHAAGGIAWVPETISGTHRDLLCGPITDGSITTFALGVITPADVVVFVDGVPIDSADYTLHQDAVPVQGDYDTTHPEALSPGLIEFDTAPTTGQRVTATATGKRVTRCRLLPDNRWTFKTNHASVQSVRAIESPEV